MKKKRLEDIMRQISHEEKIRTAQSPSLHDEPSQVPNPSDIVSSKHPREHIPITSRRWFMPFMIGYIACLSIMGGMIGTHYLTRNEENRQSNQQHKPSNTSAPHRETAIAQEADPRPLPTEISPIIQVTSTTLRPGTYGFLSWEKGYRINGSLDGSLAPMDHHLGYLHDGTPLRFTATASGGTLDVRIITGNEGLFNCELYASDKPQEGDRIMEHARDNKYLSLGASREITRRTKDGAEFDLMYKNNHALTVAITTSEFSIWDQAKKNDRYPHSRLTAHVKVLYKYIK